MTGARPHVLVARLDNIGDVLLAGPAVRAVASGARKVTFLAGPGGRAAAELLPGVDDIVSFDAPWVPYEPGPFDPVAVRALVDDLRGRSIDQAAVLTSFHQSPLPLALLLRMAGVRTIAATSVDHAGALLDVRRRPGASGGDGDGDDGDEHEVQRALGLVEQLGHRLPEGDAGGLQVRGPLPPCRPFDRPYVVVHPGASVPARGWDPERAAALVHVLAERGWAVAVTGSAQERGLTHRVAGPARPGVADLGGSLDLASLAAVLQDASVLVCGNTGPAHLAAAVGTPVASIFAPVVPAARWRPWGVPVALLGDQEIACARCRSRSCPYEDQPCLAGVTPEVVAGRVDELADQHRRAVDRARGGAA